jgi:hypothetical protein
VTFNAHHSTDTACRTADRLNLIIGIIATQLVAVRAAVLRQWLYCK